MSERLISIITPVLNGEKYLPKCLESVQNQTYPHIEHIVVDGGSTDGTLDIVKQWQATAKKLIRLVHGDDKGVGKAVNQGIEKSSGTILGWLDSDDFYNPNAIQTVMGYFVSNPKASFIYSGCDIVDSNSKLYVDLPIETGLKSPHFVIKPFNQHTWLWDWSYIVPCCASWFRRELFETVGGLNDLGNDMEWELRIAKYFKMHVIPETLGNYRLHNGSITMGTTPRAKAIVGKRLRQDFMLALKYTGLNAFTKPRPRRYLPIIVDKYRQKCQSWLGWSYPMLNRVWLLGWNMTKAR